MHIFSSFHSFLVEGLTQLNTTPCTIPPFQTERIKAKHRRRLGPWYPLAWSISCPAMSTYLDAHGEVMFDTGCHGSHELRRYVSQKCEMFRDGHEP